MKKIKRPTFLTIWLIIMMIANVVTVFDYTVGAAMLMRTMPSLPIWALPVLAVFGLVNIVTVVMIWMWKKNRILYDCSSIRIGCIN
jgi:energy-coupling factor transporter transmembrane protein EcfT